VTAGHSPSSSKAWPLGWVLSLVLHGALAGIVFLLPAEARRLPTTPIEVIERKLPEPPRPKPPEPKEEPKLEPREAPPEAKVAMVKRIPKAPPRAEPEPEAKAEPKGPPPDDTGPKTFGLKMEGTTKAAPGTGVAIPRGDSLRVSPTITKKGPEKKQEKPTGFKTSYSRGEEAPVAVVTVQPKVLRQVTAEYPERMKELGIEGRVVLELTIDGSGKVAAVRVLTGLRAELDAVAVAAARKLLFSPATVNGVPVKVKIPYTFTFVLD
jgi:protein TonB